MTPQITRKGTTYWPDYTTARNYAVSHELPTDRIIAYGLGWAIQKHVSGPYWNADTLSWLLD